jgi:predicted ArsR family transcriptional regulator
VDDAVLACLEVLASPSRQRILALLAKGVDHPEDLATKLKLRRQGVDKQLLELYEWGFVERSAMIPASGRPRIVYRLSGRGQELSARMESLLFEYNEGMKAEYQQSASALEDKLASGEMEEEAYEEARQTLATRYARFFPAAGKK